ncbi:hypothetical protein H0H92_006201, partial [Tricholoma furcatifolium]
MENVAYRNTVLPTLFDDVHRRIDNWGEAGVLNPFEEIFDLVFQMIVRIATCRELSENTEAISQLAKNYWELEQSSTPFALLFPWFPSAAKKAKQTATQGLYMLLYRYVMIRRQVGASTSDAIDVLIASGESNEGIIGFVLTTIFAGVVNTGRSVCWTILYLILHPEWKTKVLSELHTLVADYASISSAEPIHKRLGSIPMSAWEDETPVLDSVIRETLRMLGTGTALRRNLGKDFEIDGSIIKQGEFVAFSFADIHHNPEIYSEPSTFDPNRYNDDRAEDKKTPLAYVAWGAGRHPCLGMRIAKLEIKLALALVFTGYDLEIVDANGCPMSTPPKPNRNDVVK